MLGHGASGVPSCLYMNSHQKDTCISWDFPGGPVAKTQLPIEGAWVRFLPGELDPTCCNQSSPMAQGRSKLPHAATKTQFSQIKNLEKRPLAFHVDHLCARCFPGHHLLPEDSVGLSPFCQKPGLSVFYCVLSHSVASDCDPVGCSLPGFSIHGIFQARLLEWVVVSSSRGSSQPKD